MSNPFSFVAALFRTGFANPAYQEGALFYDNTEKALSYYNEFNGVTLNIGREHLVRVYNSTGGTLNNGQPVYVTGRNAGTDLPTVALSKADAVATNRCIGLLTTTIANNSIGYVCGAGVVHDLDTTAFSDGDELFVSATVAGSLTATKPSAPNFGFRIGVVQKRNAVDGKILVTLGAELEGALSADGVLFADSADRITQDANFKWRPATTPNLLIGDAQSMGWASDYLSRPSAGRIDASADLGVTTHLFLPGAGTPVAGKFLKCFNTATGEARWDDVINSTSMPARSLNTNFTPSATRSTLCTYTVFIGSSGSITITGTSATNGAIILRSDAAATPTTNRCAIGNSQILSGTVIIGVALTNTDTAEAILTYLVPPGHNVRLVTQTTTGTPTYGIDIACEQQF